MRRSPQLKAEGRKASHVDSPSTQTIIARFFLLFWLVQIYLGIIMQNSWKIKNRILIMSKLQKTCKLSSYKPILGPGPGIQSATWEPSHCQCRLCLAFHLYSCSVFRHVLTKKISMASETVVAYIMV